MKEEGHYTIKIVDKLPKRGNLNWLYVLKNEPLTELHRFLSSGSYEEISVGGVNQSVQNITDFTFDSISNILSISIENGNTMTVDLTFLKDEFTPSIIVDNYNDLLLESGQTLFEFAEVRNSQGTEWLPGSLGGTYYSEGLYYWNGTNWIHDNDAILQALQNITNSVSELELSYKVVSSDYDLVITDLSIDIDTADVVITLLDYTANIANNKIFYISNSSGGNISIETLLTQEIYMPRGKVTNVILQDGESLTLQKTPNYWRAL